MKFLQKNIHLLLGILTLVLFMFGQGVTWYAMGGDTEAYYIYFGHHIEAKPLYPLFFHILNQLFGETMYLYVAAGIQIILAVFSIILFVHYLSKSLGLDLFSTLIVWGAALVPFWLLLPEDPIPHVLMTESLTYPFMYVYIVLILRGLFEDKEKFFYFAGIFTMFLTLIRGQMLFLIAVTLVAYIYYLIKKRTDKHGIGKAIVFLLFLLVVVKSEGILTQTYEKVFFNAPAQNYSAQTFVQKALYCSDEDDMELFEDDIEKEIFIKTYTGMDEEQTVWKYAAGDLWDWKFITAAFGANSYRVQDVIEEVLTAHGLWSDDAIEQENLILEYSQKLSDKLIAENWGRCLSVSLQLMPAGFISTVLFHKASIYSLIHIATAFLYLFAIGGSILVSVWHKKMTKEAEYMLLIAGTAIVNVVASNLVHFGLQRYLAYTAGMFYVGGFLLIRRFYLKWKEGNVVRKQ